MNDFRISGLIKLVCLATLLTVFGCASPTPAPIETPTPSAAAQDFIPRPPAPTRPVPTGTAVAAPDIPTPLPTPKNTPIQPRIVTSPAANQSGLIGPSTDGVTAATMTATARTQQVDLNVHAEPSEGQPIIGFIPSNTTVTVLQRSNDNQWIAVQVDNLTGWTQLHPNLIAIDSAALMRLPIFKEDAAVAQTNPPEEATVAPSQSANIVAEGAINQPQVAQLLNQIPLVIHHAGSHSCAAHYGLNNLLPNVVAGNVLGPHAGDFVLNNVHNVLFEYDGQSFDLIMGDPAARFTDNQKSLSLDEALDLFATGQIVWTGYLGQSPARGVTGCDLFVSR